MLAFPDWRNKFVIEADASTTAVAAVLSQRNEETGQLHPIDYFSSSLSGVQRNYSAGQLEAWALVSACRKWQTYLGARGEVDLITDQCPLKWLRNQKDPRRTFARWILELEEYSYTITHRPGKENNLPDYLSRNPNVAIDAKVQDESVFEDKIFTVKTSVHVETRWDAFQMQRQQKQDPVTSEALEQLRMKGRVRSGQLRDVAEHLNVTNTTISGSRSCTKRSPS